MQVTTIGFDIAKNVFQVGAIQSDALTLRIFVIRLVGSDLRASRFCRT